MDGCGAPLLAISVTGLARAFRALVLAEPDRRAPGGRRDAGPPGLDLGYPPARAPAHGGGARAAAQGRGAEGVDAFALSDGRAGAVKVDDGAHRARTPVTVAALRLLGVTVPDELATAPVIGGQAEVGVIRAAGGLAPG